MDRIIEIESYVKNQYGATCSIQKLQYGIIKVWVSEPTSPTSYQDYTVILMPTDEIESQVDQAREEALEAEESWAE